jgi:DNA-binding NtrC family response regulator
VIDAPERYEQWVGNAGDAPAGNLPVFDIVSASRSDAPVLLTGDAHEAETVARQIHGLSGWRHGAFIVLECGLPEAELVAALRRLLFFDIDAASGHPEARLRQNGTVLLRNVEKLSLTAQNVVGDWLESSRSDRERRAGRRLMASTSSSLLPAVLAGNFDAGVYYRLNVLHLVLPRDPRPM